MAETSNDGVWKIEDYRPTEKPYYIDTNGESEIFRVAHKNKIPVMLKGPTGCGKTRFVRRMSYDLGLDMTKVSKSKGEKAYSRPLVTVPCHEDLTADDLKGRHLLSGDFLAGAALVAVKNDGILYLDEFVEARSDTAVVIHPLADSERTLFIEKLGEIYEARDPFMLVAAYNPGYQKKSKDPKVSTKQRFITLTFDYPKKDLETEIVMHEADVDERIAKNVVEIGNYIRNIKGKGLKEGASTRLLKYTAQLIKGGIDPVKACEVGILNSITDDNDTWSSVRDGLEDIFKAKFG